MIYIRHRFYIYTEVILRLNLGLIGIKMGFGGVKIGRIGICIRIGGTYLRSAIILYLKCKGGLTTGRIGS